MHTDTRAQLNFAPTPSPRSGRTFPFSTDFCCLPRPWPSVLATNGRLWWRKSNATFATRRPRRCGRLCCNIAFVRPSVQRRDWMPEMGPSVWRNFPYDPALLYFGHRSLPHPLPTFPKTLPCWCYAARSSVCPVGSAAVRLLFSANRAEGPRALVCCSEFSSHSGKTHWPHFRSVWVTIFSLLPFLFECKGGMVFRRS